MIDLEPQQNPAAPEPGPTGPKPGTCECGCGKPVSEGKRFVVGHNGRLNSKFRARSGPGSAPKPPGRTTGRRKKSAGTDYRPAVMGLLQIPATGLALAGAANPVLAADSIAVATHAPNIAEALNEIAHQRPEVAAALDRVLQVGPYSVLIAAVAPMVLQVLCNHGAIPAGLAGTVPPEVLLGGEPS